MTRSDRAVSDIGPLQAHPGMGRSRFSGAPLRLNLSYTIGTGGGGVKWHRAALT